MKKIIYTTLAILLSYSLQAQIFWTEAFENGNTAGALAAGSNTGNGPWTVTDASPTDDGCGDPTSPNAWYVSCAENGQAAGVCGAGCGTDESLHIGSTSLGDLGASYDAGGWACAGLTAFGLFDTQTDARVESPTINCTPYSTITLSFNYIENGDLSADNATLWWYNGTVWAQLFDLAKTTLCAGQGLWTAYSVVLPAGANNNPNVKIGFRWVNNDDGAGTDPSFAVDDITLSVVAAGNTITTGTIMGSPFCACAAVNVPFTSTGTFTAGNTYTAQLSNSAGSFAAPVSIGTLASTANSGTISCVIPCNTPSGTLYRIRVISSTPSITGSNNTVDIVINAPPAAPTASVTVQPTCAIPTGTIVVTAPVGATIQYSNGGTYQASGTFSGLAPGNYNMTAQNMTTGCISAVTILTVNAVPTPPAAPTASVTVQPTCAIPTGTIVVTAPVGATIQYSNGGAYQASGTFSGLAANSYNLTAQNTLTGCISNATVLVVNAAPGAPATPTASVTIQPTCAIPTGTIVVTAPAGATIQYSNGGAYQASGTFSGLAPGSYNITAQDMSSGCVSSVAVVVVSSPPGAPATPTATVTIQPSCSVVTGTIVVSAPVGAAIQYSIGGAYQASGTFSGLAPGSYSITAQDMGSGCISGITILTVNAVPIAPAAPTASVTVQPTCAVPTGTIVVTAPSGATIQYSNGGTYQASGTFSGLLANSYSITAQDMTSGCISTATVLVVNASPGAPVAPIASVTVLATCAVPTGTISVTAPVGATIQYSNGGAYQSSGTFSGLTPGSYNFTAQDAVSGCTSSATVVIVNAPVGAPAAPTASVTIQPTCSTPTGTILVSVPVGATVQYSNGGAYQVSGTFSGLAPGIYTITAQDMSTGCVSSSTSVTVNALPVAEAVDAGLDVIIPAGGNTTLTATGLGAFSWDTGETTSSILVAPTITTTYCVTLTDANGCTDTDCATVSIEIACGEIFIPTIFSPNDDFNNDKLVIYGVADCIETYNFSVYDRWGEMVFETADPLINWDGTYKGKAMNTGVYFYKLIAIKIDGTVVELSGNTTLVR